MQARINLAKALADQNQPEAALQEISKAAADAPDDAEAHYNLGLIYYRQERLEAARRELPQGAGRRPEHAEAHNNLGRGAAGEGRRERRAGRVQALRIG